MLEIEVAFAACAPGLEPALLAEATALGPARPVRGGVELSGPPGLHRRANLWLRSASRLLLRVAEIPFSGAPSLAAELAALDLRRYRRPNEPLALELDGRLPGWPESRLRPLLARALGPLSDEAPAPSLRLRLSNGRCVVSLDCSGELLHRRGYRQEGSRAPLRETLAAGILLLAGYRGEEPLWDPLCGSGTFAIEAALLARGRAPGLGRSFAFERWPSHDPAAWEREQGEARAAERSLGLPPIHASDWNAGSLGTARRNARRAGVSLELFRHDALIRWSGQPRAGLLVANLPYGKRVGVRAELPELYRGLGRRLAAMSGWRAALLVPAGELWRELRWEPSSLVRLQNGGLDCQLAVGPIGSGRPQGPPRQPLKSFVK
ncbi:MAG: THUMP domain-containing class I SAM-dependent RNA methyltransferase [Deltaproteobacteria bacterium]